MQRQYITKNSNNNSSTNTQKSILARTAITQIGTNTNAPLTQQDIENQQYQQDRFEATKLEIQAKYGTITPEGQERLNLLQPKKAEFWQRYMGNTKHYGHDFSKIPVHPKEVWPTQAIQPKLTIGTPGDKYEQEADGVAAQVVNQIHAPVTQQSHENLQHEYPAVERNTRPWLRLQAKDRNKTGLPDNLKAEIENLSGMAMDDVRVHYNSDKPAQLQALAYTQGTEIHVAPKQEKHLPHEAWHVVQQMQGRVKPTMQIKGVQINDEEGMEREADVMGMKAKIAGKNQPESRGGQELLAHELTHMDQQNGGAVQRTSKSEGETTGEPTPAIAPRTRSVANYVAQKKTSGTSSFLFVDNRPESVVQRKLQETTMRLGLPLRHGVIQCLKHGFDLIQENDNEFKLIFMSWVKEEYLPGKYNKYNITDYDNYLVLKRAEALDFTPDEIRQQTKGKYQNKQHLITGFKKYLAGFRDDPVSAMQADVSSIRHEKKNKPEEKRTGLLGTYVKKRGQDKHVPDSLGAFVEEAPSQNKEEARKEKWLRVPDEDWSSLVNAEWVTAMTNQGHDFKIVSPMNEKQKEMVRTAFNSKQKGVTFLTNLRELFYNKEARNTKNPLWDDTRPDHEADAPSTLAYEIAGLLDVGTFELDHVYENKKGMLKVQKIQQA